MEILEDKNELSKRKNERTDEPDKRNKNWLCTKVVRCVKNL